MNFIFDYDDSLEILKKKFLDWYDAGKPEYEMNGKLGIGFALIWYGIGKNILIEYEEPDRWSQWVSYIIKVNNRYFSVGYDRGLTECQEDDYDCTDESIIEVFPRPVTRIEYWTQEEINNKKKN